MDKKAFVLTMIIGTVVGWEWNFFHYKNGVVHAWDFGTGETFGILICGIPAVDWAFYAVTGFFFLTMIVIDPLKKPYEKVFGLDDCSYCSHHTIKVTNFFVLGIAIIVGIVFFGWSGTFSSILFGIPSFLALLYIDGDLNVPHFIRTGIIVVPTNVIWEIFATPITKQWWYNPESGLFSDHWWWWGIPFEMTPMLGFFAWYFIFTTYSYLRKAFPDGK